MPNAYTRVFVPDTIGSGLPDSSYLRLGAYSSDESPLVTGLETNTSPSSATSVAVLSDAVSGPGVSSTFGQKLKEAMTRQTGTHKTNNAGILFHTNKDYQANIKGTALEKIGFGHTTEVSDGDARYNVSKGAYQLSAENGLSISAGANGTPANIDLTASGSINQTAHGPVSQVTHGDWRTQRAGDTMEFFAGAKFSCMIGGTASLFIGGAFCSKLGYDFSINAGGSCTISFGVANSLTVGHEFRMVTCNLTRNIGGANTQIVKETDARYAKNYFKKIDESDVKEVGLDGTICQNRVVRAGTEITTTGLSSNESDVASIVANFKTETGKHAAKTWTSVLFL